MWQVKTTVFLDVVSAFQIVGSSKVSLYQRMNSIVTTTTTNIRPVEIHNMMMMMIPTTSGDDGIDAIYNDDDEDDDKTRTNDSVTNKEQMTKKKTKIDEKADVTSTNDMMTTTTMGTTASSKTKKKKLQQQQVTSTADKSSGSSSGDPLPTAKPVSTMMSSPQGGGVVGNNKNQGGGAIPALTNKKRPSSSSSSSTSSSSSYGSLASFGNKSKRNTKKNEDDQKQSSSTNNRTATTAGPTPPTTRKDSTSSDDNNNSNVGVPTTTTITTKKKAETTTTESKVPTTAATANNNDNANSDKSKVTIGQMGLDTTTTTASTTASSTKKTPPPPGSLYSSIAKGSSSSSPKKKVAATTTSATATTNTTTATVAATTTAASTGDDDDAKKKTTTPMDESNVPPDGLSTVDETSSISSSTTTEDQHHQSIDEDGIAETTTMEESMVPPFDDDGESLPDVVPMMTDEKLMEQDVTEVNTTLMTETEEQQQGEGTNEVVEQPISMMNDGNDELWMVDAHNSNMAIVEEALMAEKELKEAFEQLQQIQGEGMNISVDDAVGPSEVTEIEDEKGITVPSQQQQHQPRKAVAVSSFGDLSRHKQNKLPQSNPRKRIVMDRNGYTISSYDESMDPITTTITAPPGKLRVFEQHDESMSKYSLLGALLSGDNTHPPPKKDDHQTPQRKLKRFYRGGDNEDSLSTSKKEGTAVDTGSPRLRFFERLSDFGVVDDDDDNSNKGDEATPTKRRFFDPSTATESKGPELEDNTDTTMGSDEIVSEEDLTNDDVNLAEMDVVDDNELPTAETGRLPAGQRIVRGRAEAIAAAALAGATTSSSHAWSIDAPFHVHTYSKKQPSFVVSRSAETQVVRDPNKNTPSRRATVAAIDSGPKQISNNNNDSNNSSADNVDGADKTTKDDTTTEPMSASDAALMRFYQRTERMKTGGLG